MLKRIKIQARQIPNGASRNGCILKNMPPVVRGSSGFQMKTEGFIDSLNESRQTIKKMLIQKKKLNDDRKIFEAIVREQQEDIEERDLEIFYLKFNPAELMKLMAEVNSRIFRCQCMACYECGRTQDAPYRQNEAFTCVFAKKWESILDTYKISYQFYQLDEDVDEAKVMQEISHDMMGPRLQINTDIVNVGIDDLWRNVAYGRGLSRDGLRTHCKSRGRLRMLFE